MKPWQKFSKGEVWLHSNYHIKVRNEFDIEIELG